MESRAEYKIEEEREIERIRQSDNLEKGGGT